MIYIRRWVKGSVVLNYVREQETKNNYQPIENPVPERHNDIIPVVHLIVQSKKDGVRPILSNSYVFFYLMNPILMFVY